MSPDDVTERLDSAFQWLVLLLTMSFSVLFGWLTWFWKTETEPIAMSIRIFLFPIFAIILLWILKVVTKDQNKTMFLRKLAWFWGIEQSWAFFSILALVFTMDLGETIAKVSILVDSILFLPMFLLYRKVIGTYRENLTQLSFWRTRKYNYGASALGWSIAAIYFLLILYLYTFPVGEPLV